MFNSGSNYYSAPAYNSGRGYNSRSYSPSYNSGRGYGNANRVQKKHSGCKTKVVDGTVIVHGWNYSKSRGMMSFYARPYKGTREIKSASGRIWYNYFVTITCNKTLQTIKTSGLFDEKTNRVYIKDLNFVMSPSARNGGYCGTHIRKG